MMVAHGGRSRVLKISRFSPRSPTVTCILAALHSAYLQLKLKLKYALCNATSMHVTVGLQGVDGPNFKTLDRPPCATIIVAHQTFGHLRIVRPYPYCAQQPDAPEGVSTAENAA